MFFGSRSNRAISLGPKLEEWLINITEGTGVSEANRRASKIPKVPNRLRNVKCNEECYDPVAVSIGPYHHGKEQLRPMEKLKISMAKHYVEKNRDGYKKFFEEFETEARNARKCYEEEATKCFNEEDFSKMMFLDGCFILQFVNCIANGARFARTDSKGTEGNFLDQMGSQDIAFVYRDLFLLENQIPFSVLKPLIRISAEKDEWRWNWDSNFNNFIERSLRRFPDHGFTAFQKIVDIFISVKAQAPDQRNKRKHDIFQETGYHHLLKFSRDKLIGGELDDESGRGDSYPSAKELQKLGISFVPSKTSCTANIKFKSAFCCGQLTLPQINIDDASKSMLLNMAAYEACIGGDPRDFGITAYICFMDSLINQPADVKVLRSDGVILTQLFNDQQVCDLFNEMAINMVFMPFAYSDTRSKISKHCKKRSTVAVKSARERFSAPWAAAIFSTATLGIALSIVQTFLSFMDSNNGNRATANPSPTPKI